VIKFRYTGTYGLAMKTPNGSSTLVVVNKYEQRRSKGEERRGTMTEGRGGGR
jgi:hypothetical protein